MDNKERMKAIMTEILAMLDEMSDESMTDAEPAPEAEKSVHERYIDAIKSTNVVYTLDSRGLVGTKRCAEIQDELADSNRDQAGCSYYYLDAHSSMAAAEFRLITDLLLMYKWAYDRDYRPNWTNGRVKYTVARNMQSSKYEVIAYEYMRHPTVYFSSHNIAQNCAKWLNELFEL